MKYSDVIKELDSAKASGKIYNWHVVQDLNNRVVINIEVLGEKNVLYSNNYILRIENRGEDNEECFWANTIPPQLAEGEDESVVTENIINALKSENGFVCVENITFDRKKRIAYVIARFLNPEMGNNVVVAKRLIALVHEDNSVDMYVDGNYGGQ